MSLEDSTVEAMPITLIDLVGVMRIRTSSCGGLIQFSRRSEYLSEAVNERNER